MKKKLVFFVLLAVLVLPLSVVAKTLTEDTILTEDVKDGILISKGNVTLNLGGKSITNAEGQDTIKVEKGATLTIVGEGDVTNTSNGKAVISNDGTLIVEGGTYGRVETESAKYYVLLNHGIATINGGTFKTTSEGIDKSKTSSLIDNGWYNPELNTEKIFSELTINGGKYEIKNNNKYIKNDDYGKMTVNGGIFTMYEPSNAIIQNAGFASGEETLIINGGEFNYTGLKYAIWDYDWNPSGYTDKSITTINGGVFNLSSSEAKITNIKLEEDVNEYKTIDGEVVVAKKEDIKDVVEIAGIKKEDVPSAELALIEKAVENKYTIVGLYNIDLFEGIGEDIKISQVTESDELVSVTLPAPTGLEQVADGYKRIFYVVRVHNNKTDILDATVNSDGTITFKTDKFSTYTLVYNDVKNTTVTNPNTSDSVSLYIALALLSLCIAVLSFKRLAKNN